MAEISDARKRANKKWNDANMTTRYDRLNILVPKGRKAEIQTVAENAGMSLNGFVTTAIDRLVERIECDKADINTGDMKGVSENAGL